MKLNKKIKLEHFANLVAIAYADGFLSDTEMELLKTRAYEYGLEQTDVDNIFAQKEHLEFLIPLNSEECEEQLSEAVLMSLIDGEIQQKEYQLCLRIAEKLGFDEKFLNYTIDLSKKLLKGEI